MPSQTSEYVSRPDFLLNGFHRLPVPDLSRRCSVCWVDQPIIWQTKACGHEYCQQCIWTWAYAGTNQTCPVCRKPLWIAAYPFERSAFALEDRRQVLLAIADDTRVVSRAGVAQLIWSNLPANEPGTVQSAMREAAVATAHGYAVADETTVFNQDQSLLAVNTMRPLLPEYYQREIGDRLTEVDDRRWRALMDAVCKGLWTIEDGTEYNRRGLPHRVESMVAQWAAEKHPNLLSSDWFTQPEDYDIEDGDGPTREAELRRWMFIAVLRHVARIGQVLP